MSTFDGVIREYPLISIDQFLEGKNYASTVYFLSHCHKDHTRGLNSRSFLRLLQSRTFSKIYLSDVSSHLIKNDFYYNGVSDYLVVLPMEEPTLIMLYNEEGIICSSVTVTLLTAGHCPGSVMFLIEGDNGRVLYTGDFRLPIGSAARMKNLHEKDSLNLKPLQSMYVDTTFCNKKCLYIPSREECLSKIMSLVGNWLPQGPNYVVYILCPYELAYEFVFVELYKRFGVKTHVSEVLLRKYTGIKKIEDAVTSCASDARIHACVIGMQNIKDNPISDFYLNETPCGFVSPDKKPVRVRKIMPSAQFFTRKAVSQVSEYIPSLTLHRVFYSTHPSLTEIRDMVYYLKPKEVFPNVVKGQTVEKILDLIYPPETASPDCSFSPLGMLQNHYTADTPSDEIFSLPFFDKCYEIEHELKNPKNSLTKGRNTSNLNENLCIETDFENTEEQEIMLKEEIYSQTVEGRNGCSTNKSPLKWVNPISSSDEETDPQTVGERNHFGIVKSPLKWENPVVSSDEELFESSPDSSLRDKYDSDVGGGTSEEIDVKNLNTKTNSGATSFVTIPKSTISTPSKSSASQSLITENYVIDGINSTYNVNINNSIMNLDNDVSHIDIEYAKISEIDNGMETNLPVFKEYEKEKNELAKDSFQSFKFSSAQKNVCKESMQIPSHLNSGSAYGSNLRNKMYSSENLQQPDMNCLKVLEKSNKKRSLIDNLKDNTKQNEHVTDPCNSHQSNIFRENTIQIINGKSEVNLQISKFASNTIDNRELPKHESRSFSDSKQHGYIKSSDTSDLNRSHVKIKKSSKTFQYIKKLNSESDSDDEYTFKYVIKQPDKDTNNTSLKSKVCNSNEKKSPVVKNERNQNESLRNDQLNDKKCSENTNIFYIKRNPVENSNQEGNNFPSAPHRSLNNVNRKEFVSSQQNFMLNKSLSNGSKASKLKESVHDSKLYMHHFNAKLASGNSFLPQINGNSFKRATSASLSDNFLSVNHFPCVQNDTTEEKIIKASDKNCLTVNSDLIDLASDNSNDEISVTDPEEKAYYKTSSHETLLASASLKKSLNSSVSCKTTNKESKDKVNCANRNPEILPMTSEIYVSDIENSYGIRRTESQYKPRGMLTNSLNKPNNVKLNHIGKESEESPEIFLDNEICCEAKDRLDSNKNKFSFAAAVEIKLSSQSSSGSSVIVEEVHSASDTDDSPSLIAPIINVSSSGAKTCVNSHDNSKRRKIILSQRSSFIKPNVCDNLAEKDCDNFLMDSDNTPDDLIVNCNVFSVKKQILEIVIDD